MKLTTLLLIVGIMQVSATSLAQRVVLSEKNAPLAEVFEKISQQTGYDFVFTKSILNSAKPITLQFNGELGNALKMIFSDEPLDYQISDKSVLVKTKELGLINKINNLIVAIEVTGRVTDENNQPLAGVSITVKDGKNSTATDANGFFLLKQVQPTSIIVISSIGYEKQELAAKTNLGLIKLLMATSKLDEVKVIAYGQTTERYSIDNTTTIKAKDIESVPVNNPVVALMGRVPGLFVTQNSGIAGGGVTVRIQGQNSLANGSDPLYVIDGVPYMSQILAPLGNILGSSGGQQIGPFGASPYGNGNPLNYLNLADIESISVLKDADATAIYGSRAANGAILINTKKGKVGQTTGNLNLQQGYGHITNEVKLMNTAQYLQMRREAFKNDGATPGPTDYDVNGLWDQSRYTDWQKVLIGGTSKYTNLNGGISGGNSLTQFRLSGNYHKETTVFPGDFNDQKGGVSFSINSASVDQKFKLQFTGNYIIDLNRLPGADLTYSAIGLAPDAPPLYNPDGSLNWAPDAAGSSSWSNPLAGNNNSYSNKTNNLVSDLVLSYQILSDLSFRTNFGYTNMQQNETQLYPLTAIAPEYRAISTRSANFSYANYNSWIVEPQLNYKKTFDETTIDFLAGATVNQNVTNVLTLFTYGQNSDLVLQNPSAASGIGTSTNYFQYKYNALFARFNLVNNYRYIFDFTGRRDGSSRFGSDNQYHDFWSAGLGWIISNEDFIKNKFGWLSFAKLKASYGTTGNDQIGDYKFLTLYNFFGASYQNQVGISAAGLPNPNLQWEETRKLSAGIDLGFFEDRIMITANYFRNRSSNQLLLYSLPTQTGFSSIAKNFPATVQNSGLELTVNTVVLKTKDCSWTASFNLTLPNNKLIAFPGIETSSYSNLKVGQSIQVAPVNKFAGVNPTTGIYQFYKNDGSITTDPVFRADQTNIDLSPKYYGGALNTINYRSFSLSFLLQFANKVGNNYRFGASAPQGAFNYNANPNDLNNWKKPGDAKALEKFSQDFSTFTAFLYATGSDAAYTAAPYLRLKTLSVSWKLPQKCLSSLALKDCSIYLEGQNLFTVTSYPWIDPENFSATSLPPLRIITAGLKVGL